MTTQSEPDNQGNLDGDGLTAAQAQPVMDIVEGTDPVTEPDPPSRFALGHPYHPYDEAPCQPWPLDPTCMPPEWRDMSGWPPELERAHLIASEFMWRLTAGRFGWCCETIRPCRKGCPSWVTMDMPAGMYAGPYGAWGGPFTPLLIGGKMFNISCSCSGDSCQCGNLCELKLPGPVLEVQEVKIDGQALPISEFSVINRDTLIRQGNQAGECWPWCQRLDLPDTEEGTWSITYLRGRDVPPMGRRAVTALMVEMWKDCGNGGTRCGDLPRNLTQIAREGVTLTKDVRQSLIDAGIPDIPAVYQWVQLVNPYNARGPSGVFSPDLPSHREVTWRGGWVG